LDCKFSSTTDVFVSGLDVDEAIAVAKKCRPIIDPIGDFPLLLARLRSAELQELSLAVEDCGAHASRDSCSSSSSNPCLK
jgi:hypothetical protein